MLAFIDSVGMTEAMAAGLAGHAQAGDIIALTGGLGMGKTVFARGFARGLGYGGYVTSPTFSLMNIYETERLTMYHFDLYRLPEGREGDALEAIGFEDYLYGDGVCVIEWADRAGIFDGPEWAKRLLRVDISETKNGGRRIRTRSGGWILEDIGI